nr:CDP-alcohol phosphatidyltransferase family protein [Candidatus Njordarchaeum guaymaensis]
MSDNRLRLRVVFRPVVNSIAVLLIRMRLTPNMVTTLGALLATITPFLMGSGEYIPFGLTVFLVGLLDGVDGAIARITRRTTKWGGFLDSTLDRYGDCIIFLAYLFGPMTAPLGQTEVLSIQFRVWVCIAIMGSLMVSYTRAKSEAIGVGKCDIGIAARSERLLILSITGALGVINEYITIYGLIATAILANITALQRITHTYSTLKRKEK